MKSKITITKKTFLTILTCCLFAITINAQTAPVVVSRVPTHNATNVGLNSSITVTFDQPIELGIAVRRLKIINTDTGVTFQSYGFADLTISGNTLTMSHSILPYNTNFHITIDSDFVRNASGQGNSYYGNSSWLFSTESDTYAPILTAMTPPDGSVGVYENSNLLSYSFNETIQAGSGNIIVRRVDNDAEALNVDVTNPSEVIVSGSSFTIVSTSSTFDYSTEYYVEFPSGVIEDLLGNPFAGIGAPPLADHNFTMRDAPVDTSPPTAISYSPADDATGVDVNTDFTITFNEDVQIGTGSFYVRRPGTGTIIYQIDISNASVTGSAATFTLPDNLFRLTTYYIWIEAGAFTDLAGNDYAGTSTPFVWNFTTATASDVNPPVAATLTPLDNASNVSIANDLTLDFSEAVQLYESAVLKDFGGNVIPSTSTVSGSTLTINPTSDLANSTQYYVEIAYGAIRDLAGNSFAGFSGNTTWNFTTEAAPDTTPPSVNVYTPTNNSTGTSISNNLTLTFNEDVQLITDAILKNYDTNAVISSSSSVSGNTLTVNPTSDLSYSTHYYVTLANGGIQDLAGNNFIGFSTNATWNFTTGVAPDTTPPSPSIFSPLDNATGVSLTNNITITFDETIQLSGGFPILRNFDTNAEVISTSFVFSGSNLIINPTNDLSENTQYYIEIANGIIQDIAGNSYSGLSGNTAWNFTTLNADVTPPSAVTFSPIDNATDVSISNNLVLTFDEDIQISGGRAVLKNFNTNVEIGSSSTASGNQLIINPTSDLDENTQYYIEILNGIITDLAGNPYTGFSGNSTWNFTTVADGTPPSIVAFIPASGATNSSVSNNLVLGFTENIQISGGRAVLKNFNTNVEIGSSSSVIGNKLYINPTTDLDPTTQYYVEIANGIIQDLAGNNYAGFSGNATWNFTTGNILAVDNFDLKQHLNIYPNPATDVLNITISDLNEDLTVVIYDILGKKVFSQKLTETNNQLNLSSLTTGIYLLKTSSVNKNYTTRIVKK